LVSRLSFGKQLLFTAGLAGLLLAAGLLLVLTMPFDRLLQRACEQTAEALATLVGQASGRRVATALAVGDPAAAGEPLAVLRATPQVELAAIDAADGNLLVSCAPSPEHVAPTGMVRRQTAEGVEWTDASLVAWQEMRDGADVFHGTVEL